MLSLAGDIVRLEVSAPAAPGSRKDATLPSGSALRVKVHRVKKLETPPWFFLEGRLIDPSRAVREELERLARPAPTTASAASASDPAPASDLASASDPAPASDGATAVDAPPHGHK